MDKRKLAMTAGGASIVAAALAMNVGTAAAECDQVVACDGGGSGGFLNVFQKIDNVMNKLNVFDKASPAVSNLQLVLSKLVLKFGD